MLDYARIDLNRHEPLIGPHFMQVARAKRLYLMNHVNHEMWHYIKKWEVNTSLVGFGSPPRNHVGRSFLPIIFCEIFVKK